MRSLDSVMYKIPFNKPFVSHAKMSFFDGTLTNGPYTRLCKEWIERRYRGSRVYMTHSGTGALELMAMIYRPKYATIPSFTHVSTVNAFARVGTKIKLTDISLTDFMGIRGYDIGCNYNGNSSLCDMIDSAHGFSKRYYGSPMAVSFHETKNVSCGEGGALILYNNFDKADQIYRMGTNREAFNRGEVDQYEWTCVGSSFTPSEFQMAYLWGQLERYDEIQARRAELWSRYANELHAVIPQGVSHVFPLLVPGRRDHFITRMGEHGIQCVSHYTPLHLSPMGRKRGGHEGQLPNTEYVARSIVRLPLYYSMTDAEQMEVIKAVKECL